MSELFVILGIILLIIFIVMAEITILIRVMESGYKAILIYIIIHIWIALVLIGMGVSIGG